MSTIKEAWLKAHEAIHQRKQSVMIGHMPIFIQKTAGGLRFLILYDLDLGCKVKIMEQNPCKPSKYAEKARNGETISWVIPENNQSSWTLIDKPVGVEV